ncbi:MAG: ATP-binding protein [Firmicutes bacterium HGW-Firmicutes-14]|jgi:Mrp family chromosome partitioning ATPase|nr:MAG: ATP-binding protein [Firmicutes bacterium HGW-Firmicutes-14]
MAEACKTCGDSSECTGEDCPEVLKEMQRIKNVIAVMSGKGGVGKSTVTGLMAAVLRERGYSVGIMDADVTGPSIPRIFGLNNVRLKNGTRGIIPARTPSGIEVISVNLLLPNEEEPVIWRGPVISGVIKQFWTEVEWGELDFLLVDLPPGTGDAPLTVMQSLPLTGVIIVTSPQNLVSMIVRKAVNMVYKMNLPVIGLVENMVYLECPDCKKQIKLFGSECNTEEMAGKSGTIVLGQLPLDPKFVDSCDKGRIEEYLKDESRIKKVILDIIRHFPVDKEQEKN